ncbi:uncharacterized protein LOC115269875 [Aedes albopictus]|uniref:Uncharacterized protein n=1 Tax=Aedes albopictus TaxID=7160 RepID=A0ABM1XSJ5_AEDAL
MDSPNDVFEDEEYLDLNLDQDEDQTNHSDGTFESDSTDAKEGSSKSISDYVFVFTGVFFRRLYRGQLRPREFGRQTVEGDSVPEVLEFVWNAAKAQTQRQVVFDDEVPRWAEKQEPDLEDIELFLTLYDETKKKTYAPSALTPRVLATWRDKSIKIFAYVYSTTVETAAQYQLVLRQLLEPTSKDRAGAHSMRDDAALAQALRDTHQHLEGHQSSWLLWANLIHSSPAHTHEKLKAEEAPPLQLSKYFRWTAVSEPVKLQSAHRGLAVAHTVNDSWMRELMELKSDLDRAFDLIQSVRQRVNLMAARGTTSTQIFAAMEDAVRPEESELSRELAEKVTDCQDVDHA